MASRPNSPGAQRPRSPHLFSGFLRLNYRWGPHMLVSILHRVTGDGMATVGTVLLVWWLAALASGAEAYKTFRGVFTTDAGSLNPIGWIIGVGLTLALFQHIMSGIRHLVMDTGAAFELKVNKTFAVLTMVGAVVLTAIFWLYLGTK